MNKTGLLNIAIILLTLCSLRAQGQEVFNREIESTKFVPKGQWITGVSFNYNQSSQNNYQFFVLEGLSGDTYSFRVTPMVLYAFKDDMAAGVKAGYTRSLTKLEKGSIVLDSETSFDVNNLYRLSHNYYGMAVFRNYFSLGRSKRFGFFSELQLEVGGGQSKLMSGKSTEIIGAYERNVDINVGVAPGLIVFLNNYSAIEVNVGVLGFHYTHTKQLNNQIYESNRNTKYANFNINLFSITFGAAFYL